MAMTEKQIEGVLSLFVTCFVNESDEVKRKKIYLQFNDNFGGSIGDWTTLAIEKIGLQTDNIDIIDEFNKLSSKEKEDLSADIEIRKLCRADFEQIRELIRNEFGTCLSVYDELGLQSFLRSEHSFVACKDSEILGVILAGKMPNISHMRIYIDTFVITASMRGRGIGHKLYKAVINAPMGQKNVAEMVLKTEKNREAYQIYKHWGFRDADLIYMSNFYVSHEKEKKEDKKVVKNRHDRIKYILDNYHPILLSGEVSMTFAEASRLIEICVEKGKSEDEAFEILKYCTVGEDFVEEE